MTDSAELTMANLGKMSDEVRSETGPAATTRTFNESLIAEFRASGGVLSGELARARFVLLTTKGAKSGRERTTPLAHITNVDGAFEVKPLRSAHRLRLRRCGKARLRG